MTSLPPRDARNNSKILSADTSRLQEKLNILTENQVESAARTKIPQSHSATHQEIPPEILAKIFTYCVNGDVVELRSRIWDPLPWVLGHVCSRWRQVVRAEPLLWRRIDARGYSPLPSSTVKLILEILENRGGTSVIELQITPGCNEDWDTLFGLCSKYPSRLRSLCLTIDAWYSPSRLRSPILMFDNLESVILNFCRPSYATCDIEGATAVTAFTNAHRLRRVEIHREGSHNPSLIDINSFPWAQLTSLIISCISPVAISQILCECVELIDLDIGLQVNGFGCHYVLPTVIHLNHLQSITIRFGVGGDAFLDRLNTPALKNLIFGQWALASQRSILDLVERSDCDLEILHCPADETPDIISLLKVTPYLQELVIPASDPIPQEAFDILRIKNLSPGLRALVVPVGSIHSVIHFLQSRWTKSTAGVYEGIRCAKIMVAGEDFVTQEEWFQMHAHELRKNGCRVEIVLI